MQKQIFSVQFQKFVILRYIFDLGIYISLQNMKLQNQLNSQIIKKGNVATTMEFLLKNFWG